MPNPMSPTHPPARFHTHATTCRHSSADVRDASWRVHERCRATEAAASFVPRPSPPASKCILLVLIHPDPPTSLQPATLPSARGRRRACCSCHQHAACSWLNTDCVEGRHPTATRCHDAPPPTAVRCSCSPKPPRSGCGACPQAATAPAKRPQVVPIDAVPRTYGPDSMNSTSLMRPPARGDPTHPPRPSWSGRLTMVSCTREATAGGSKKRAHLEIEFRLFAAGRGTHGLSCLNPAVQWEREEPRFAEGS